MVSGKYSGAVGVATPGLMEIVGELSQPPPAAGILHRFISEPLASSYYGYLQLHITFLIQVYTHFSKNSHVSCPGNHSH